MVNNSTNAENGKDEDKPDDPIGFVMEVKHDAQRRLAAKQNDKQNDRLEN